jgi:hypothetical protein
MASGRISIQRWCLLSIPFRNLSYDRSIASSKASLQRVGSSASSFNFQYPLLSLRSSSSSLHPISRLLVLPIRTYSFPSIMCFSRQFLRKMRPIQLAFLIFVECKMFLFPVTPCNTSHFSHDRSNSSSPSLSSITFQNLSGIYNLLSQLPCTSCNDAVSARGYRTISPSPYELLNTAND